jgi:hypothetical protein
MCGTEQIRYFGLGINRPIGKEEERQPSDQRAFDFPNAHCLVAVRTHNYTPPNEWRSLGNSAELNQRLVSIS